MSKYILLLLVLALIYLTIPFSDNKKTDKDYIEPIQYLVETELSNYGVVFEKADITLNNLTAYKNTVGLTKGVRGIYLYIQLQREYFIQATDEVKEALILHEYGHYLGIYNHTNTNLNTANVNYECSYSVMHESSDLVSCFSKFRDHYYRELVNQLKKQ